MRVRCVMVGLWVQMGLWPVVQAQHSGTALVADLSEISIYRNGDPDAFAWLANAAALGYTTRWNTAVFALRKYLLPGLGEYRISGSFPTISGGIGVQLGYSGSSYVNTAEAGLAYGRSLGSRVRVGAGFDLRQLSIRGLGREGHLYARAAFLYVLSSQVFASAQLILPATSSEPGGPRRQVATATGLGYVLSPQASIAMSLKKEAGLKASLHCSLLYQPQPDIQLRAGTATGEPVSWLSTGWQIRAFRVEIVGSYHYRLGLSPGIIVHLNQSTLSE